MNFADQIVFYLRKLFNPLALFLDLFQEKVLPDREPVHDKETDRPANRVKDGHPKYELAGLHNLLA